MESYDNAVTDRGQRGVRRREEKERKRKAWCTDRFRWADGHLARFKPEFIRQIDRDIVN